MTPALSAHRDLPGPRRRPFLGWRGNLLAFYRDPITFVQRGYQAYGEFFALAADPPQVVFALGPSANAQVLADPARFASPFLPEPLPRRFSDPSEALKRHPDLVTAYGATVLELTDQLLERWGIGQQLDVDFVMQRLALRIAAKTLLGIDDPERVDQIGAAVQSWTNSMFGAALSAWPLHLPGRAEQRVQRRSALLDGLIQATLDQNRARGAAPLHALLWATDQATELHGAELAGHVAAQFSIGYETLAAALTWTLFLLSQHLRILNDLGDALLRELGPAPSPHITVEQLERVPLLERVINESLRLLPPRCFGARMTTADGTLGMYRIPAGTTVVYSPYWTQRMPELYFAPQKFRPERWLYIEPSAAEFLPFGGAAAGGLGAPLALLGMKLVLARLLGRYRLALAPGAQIDRSVRLTLRPKAGMPMIITRPDHPVIRREPHGNIRDILTLS